jgi:uncharacterized membrane protein
LNSAVPGFAVLDYLALIWFLACWAGYTNVADHSRWSRHSVSAAMDGYRRAWMAEMMARELRMVDTQIVGNLLSGIGFFASATILVVGGLVAVLGAAEQAIDAMAELPFALPTTRPVWEMKILLLITIFVYAFFKLAWAFRLTNNCSILIGAAPAVVATDSTGQDTKARQATEAEAAVHAKRAAAVISLSGHHFNRGLRAYFFALAALGWFVHPILFALATAWVVFVLYRREFRSRALRAIRGNIGGAGPAA